MAGNRGESLISFLSTLCSGGDNCLRGFFCLWVGGFVGVGKGNVFF